jgi:hypothetical protein
MIAHCRRLLQCNTTIEEDDGNVPLFSNIEKKATTTCCHPFFIVTPQRRQNTQENNNQKKNQEKGGNLLSSSHFALSLLAPAFALLF